MNEITVEIAGKVQGVFFRHSARQQAKALNLRGWVKNLPKGSVLCQAAGSQASLLAFIDWCKQGPPRAKVENVTVQWLKGEDGEQSAGETVVLSDDFQIIG